MKKLMKAEMDRYTILPQFKDWAIEMLNKYNDSEIKRRTDIHKMQAQAIMTTQGEIDNLTKMRYRSLIDDEEYLKEKKDLKAKIAKLKEQIGDTERRAENWMELTEKTFEFITYAAHHYKEGSFEERRTILTGFGSNFLIKDKKLQMLPHEWLIPIDEEYKQIEKEYLSLEPEERALESGRSARLEQICIKWRREGDSGWRSQPRHSSFVRN